MLATCIHYQVSASLSTPVLQLKKDPPPIKRQETPLERRRRRAAERESAHSAVVEDSAKAWDPASDAKAKGSDPYRTLFVGRLAYETNERKLEREFGEFGRVTGVRVVRDPDSGNSRGYGFVEFETEDALKEAYRRAGEAGAKHPWIVLWLCADVLCCHMRHPIFTFALSLRLSFVPRPFTCRWP